MSFDYEQSIWGKGTASLKWSDPTAFRLKQALGAIASLPAGSKVLELGSGAGQFIRAIKQLRPDLQCYGADVSNVATNVAKSANDGVEYVVSSENTVPFENNFFDAVLIFDVLEHVQSPDAILNEVHRLLRAGGTFYAFVPCEGDWTSMWHFLDMFGLKRDLTKKYAGHINYFTTRELRSLVKHHQFTEVSVRYSEQALGQLLGVVAFHMMDAAALGGGGAQINNEAFFEKKSGSSIALLKKLVNSLVYIETVIFQRVSSPNVHLVVRK